MPYNCGLTLGSWSLPDPTGDGGWNPSPDLRVIDNAMADGTITTDVLNTTPKHKFEIRWENLTKLEFDDVEGAWSQFVATSSTLALDGMNLSSAVTVTRDIGVYDVQVTASWRNNQYLYDATMRLREV